MKGVSPIESWDETYVHTKHNTNRLVLAERRDVKATSLTPWVREQGRGRVFYTGVGTRSAHMVERRLSSR
jgi:type 1 glutamine amidotransferase